MQERLSNNHVTVELSIVIPVYVQNPNEISQVKERIESFKLLSGLYGGTQLIVVDDGSCPEMIEAYESLDMLSEKPECQAVILPTNESWGQPRARNIGMQIASGRKILLTDVDHLVTPLTFAHLLQHTPGKDEVIMFKRRVIGTNVDINPHPCTLFFLNDKPLYFHEQFVGNYGSDDTYWILYHDLKVTKSNFYVMVNQANNNHNLYRDESVNKQLMQDLLKSGEEPKVTKLEEFYEGYRSISNHK